MIEWKKKKPNKLNKKNKNKYRVINDKKMLGSIILIIVSIVQIFAFLQVPFLSSINGYTIGMLIGFYNPFFYLFVAYLSLIMIFDKKLLLPKWFKLTKPIYCFIVLSIIFIGSSTGYYQSKDGYTEIGTDTWSSFNTWYKTFTDSSSAWTPTHTNGGIIAVFMYSFVSMISTGIGALILSIIFFVLSLSFIITGSPISLYKNIITKKKLDIREKDNEDKKNADFAQFELDHDKHPDEKKDNTNIQNKDEKRKNIDSFPFDDPF